MKNFNRETGRLGEELAAEFLTKKGMIVKERNFSTRFGEIDLICMDNDLLVFVEVKTKKGASFGTPEEMFTQGKKNKVKRMATIYLKGKEVKCRVDMVAVVLNFENEVIRITHYENVS